MMTKQFSVEVKTSLSPDEQKMLMELEKDAFPGIGAVDEQTLVPIARFGRLICCYEDGDERPVGVCEVLRDYEHPTRAYIFGYYIRSDKQGLGVGKYFFNEVMELLKQDDFAEICLTVDVDNTPAVKIYEKLGFDITETRKNEFGENEDRYFMIWKR